LPYAAALILAVGAMAPHAVAQNAFVPGFDDLPMMPGLTPGSDGPTVFDAPGGRIVESQVDGRGSPARVMDFYRDTLPQLGWQAAGPEGTFEREGELLRLQIHEVGRGQITVRFSLAPAPNGGRP
jgi:hypothetical protein